MAEKKKDYKWSYVIDPGKCMNCATCEVECRDNAIYIKDYEVYAINDENCVRCARCYQSCPVGAVQRIPVSQAS